MRPELQYFKTQTLGRRPKYSGPLPLVQNRVNLILVQDRVLLAFDRDLVAAVFAEQHAVAGLDGELVSLPVVQHAALAGGNDLAFLGLLLGGVGKVEARGRLVFLLRNLHDDFVAEWL